MVRFAESCEEYFGGETTQRLDRLPHNGNAGLQKVRCVEVVEADERY
jgi:hypothetical protein